MSNNVIRAGNCPIINIDNRLYVIVDLDKDDGVISVCLLHRLDGVDSIDMTVDGYTLHPWSTISTPIRDVDGFIVGSIYIDPVEFSAKYGVAEVLSEFFQEEVKQESGDVLDLIEDGWGILSMWHPDDDPIELKGGE